MIQVSTKFKELILGANSFESIFNGGRILVYSGSKPSTADMPASGTLLGQITADGETWFPDGVAGGLTFSRSSVYAMKLAAQPWKLVKSAAGTAGWFRLVGPVEDPGGLSYSHPRIDGSVGVSGTDLVLQSTNFIPGGIVPIDQFYYTILPII
jgi:hypothetical protein